MIEPSKAGACVPTPVALVMPVTPSGRSAVASVSSTPVVSSSVCFAWASTSSGDFSSSAGFVVAARGQRQGGDAHEEEGRDAAQPTGPGVATGGRMPSAFHTGGRLQGGGNRPGGGRDRLAAGDAGTVAPAGRLGQVDGAPLAAAALAGAAPAHAKTRASSPLRKRWQRTPPVARPLGGYSENGVTFTAPGSVPGSAVEEPEAVTTTASAASTAPNHATRSPRSAGRRRCRRPSGPAGAPRRRRSAAAARRR